jgi:hypothetical protein
MATKLIDKSRADDEKALNGSFREQVTNDALQDVILLPAQGVVLRMPLG